MTDPSRPDGPARSGDIADSETPDPPEASAPRALGLAAFTMEGRRAPALFVVGWLATLIGVGFVGLRFLGLEGLAGEVIAVIGTGLAALGLVLLAGSQSVERRAAGMAYAGPSPVLVMFAALAGIPFVASLIGLPLVVLNVHIPLSIGNLILELVKLGVFVGVIRIAVIGSDAMRWSDMGLRADRGEILRGLATGAVFAGPVILVTGAVLYVVVLLANGLTPPSPLPPSRDALGLISNLAIAAVLAPFSEELLFRGFALTAWRRSVGVQAAILRSALVFVLAHVLGVGGDSFGQAATLALIAGVGRIPVALALGWLFARTDSVWASIGLHATYNAVLVLLAAGV
ncbi:MAG TPA: type II CAAX endopeptidase family protein [Candidatus Limnocylindrales bacterium]|nr:type II CAAX endopeptidase family protein [Candidatus Limnocylindrales bacterium]